MKPLAERLETTDDETRIVGAPALEPADPGSPDLPFEGEEAAETPAKPDAADPCGAPGGQALPGASRLRFQGLFPNGRTRLKAGFAYRVTVASGASKGSAAFKLKA